ATSALVCEWVRQDTPHNCVHPAYGQVCDRLRPNIVITVAEEQEAAVCTPHQKARGSVGIGIMPHLTHLCTVVEKTHQYSVVLHDMVEMAGGQVRVSPALYRAHSDQGRVPPERLHELSHNLAQLTLEGLSFGAREDSLQLSPPG